MTHLARRFSRRFSRRSKSLTSDDAGMSTVEYAIGTIAAAAFAAVLYSVVTSYEYRLLAWTMSRLAVV